ncbi:MAG TPA: hypothetical protein VF618_12970 [Thermoanaerobaculia bacterium]
MLARFWWLFAVALLWILHSEGVSWKANVSIVVPATAVYWLFVAPALMNVWAMIALAVGPLTWPPRERHVSASRPPQPPGLGSFVLSFPVPLYLGASLGSIAAVGHFVSDRSSWWKTVAYVVAVTVSNALIRLTMLTLHGAAEQRRSLALFWRFHADNASVIKNYLTPVLAAYGRVQLIDDRARRVFAEARNDVPDGAPVGHVERIDGEDDSWREAARDLIRTVDIAVIDVTDLGYWVPWEILECLDSPKRPIVILIGRIEFLFPRHEFVDQLRDGLLQHTDAAKTATAIACLEPPLPYSTDLSHVIFKWRFFRRLQRLSGF